MKINRTGLPLLLSVALAGCVAAPVPPPPAAPAPKPTQAPPPSKIAERAAPKDWRDAAQTPGDWVYAPLGNGSEARFVSNGGATLALLRCDRPNATVTFYRNGSASAPVPASIATSSETRNTSAVPVSGGAVPMLAIAIARNDRLLDAFAFSRGRFAIDINGLPTLYLPAWAEIGRVVEDCRKA
ncbi:hypothetical protein [Novosphingobium olei]|uniref:Lipoprotein n=1 Tax=Novosphingobium olei TaxID=2728851 RepID=A0A7Y0G8R4_9SPHN|nr:hypothetical protein [Novosphingobium olei]NML92109.1 hypothetical protein [Novosphingobium olei]